MKNLLGKKYKIYERKSSKFGTVGTVDRGNELSFSKRILDRNGTAVSQKYYNNIKRDEIYRTALDKYIHDELARPIINLIAYAIFAEGPDFQGDKDLVKAAKKIVDDSMVDWSTWGADLEVHGDVFIESFVEGKNPKIASLPAQTINVDYNEDNIIDIKNYIQNFARTGERKISPEKMPHIKINNTTNMVFGSSTLRPCFWWLDVLDNLWERNWIRAAQYYGSPIVSVTGVPAEHIEAVKAALQLEAQRPGRNWVFPEGVVVETLDFTRNYPIELLIDRVYQYILSACNIPQHLIYESDSSRGVAMFSGDAFDMMIKMRQRTWGLGIVHAIRNIFRSQGTANSEGKLFIRWAPVFQRDLKDLANLIKVGMENNLYSRKSAREKMRLDHSEEVVNLKKQKIEEPDDKPKEPSLQRKVGNIPKASPNK